MVDTPSSNIIDVHGNEITAKALQKNSSDDDKATESDNGIDDDVKDNVSFVASLTNYAEPKNQVGDASEPSAKRRKIEDRALVEPNNPYSGLAIEYGTNRNDWGPSKPSGPSR